METQWPLVIFTLFVCLTCGTLGGMSILALKGQGRNLQMTALITSAVSLVVGGIGAFLHLEHWERIFNGFGHLTSGITQELIAIVQDNHPLAGRGAMYLSDLKDYRLTTYRDTIPIGKVVRKLLKEKGVEAVYSYDDEISIAGRISKSSKVAIVADTPYLRQFNNLAKVRLLDVPKDTRMIYMVYSNKNFITSAVEAFANFMVANCLNMPE